MLLNFLSLKRGRGLLERGLIREGGLNKGLTVACLCFTGKQAHLTGLDIQGKRFSNQYITQFKVGYKTDDTQQFPQYYPSDSNPKVRGP